jgi:hypothetical protein
VSTVVECAVCGRTFRYLRAEVCGDCDALEEGAFRIVRAFLDKEPDATIKATVEATGVSGGQISRLVDQGRLQFRETANGDAEEAERRRRIAMAMAWRTVPGASAGAGAAAEGEPGEGSSRGMKTRRSQT